MAGSQSCDLDPQDLMQKIYEIIQLVQTLQSLINQINQICVQSAARYVVGWLFYFTPQLNPFVWVDAFETVKQQRETPDVTEKASGHQRRADGADGSSERQAQGGAVHRGSQTQEPAGTARPSAVATATSTQS